MAQFELVTTASSQLWDFGWFDVSRFRVAHHTEATPTWQDSVRSFFADPISQRRFCTSPDPWGAACGHHGPFQREKLDAEWFQVVPAGELVARLRTSFDADGLSEPPSEEQQRLVLAWAAEAEARGGIVAELIVPADRDARLDWAEMVWIVFREYICFTADGGELSVAVIGYD